MQSYFSFLVTGCLRWPFYLILFSFGSPSSASSLLSCLTHGATISWLIHRSVFICSLFSSLPLFQASSFIWLVAICNRLHFMVYHSWRSSGVIFFFFGRPRPRFSSIWFLLSAWVFLFYYYTPMPKYCQCRCRFFCGVVILHLLFIFSSLLLRPAKNAESWLHP